MSVKHPSELRVLKTGQFAWDRRHKLTIKARMKSNAKSQKTFQGVWTITSIQQSAEGILLLLFSSFYYVYNLEITP